MSINGQRRRVDRLEDQAGPRKKVTVVLDRPDETSDEAVQRHLADHPEDKAPEFIVVDTGVPRSDYTRGNLSEGGFPGPGNDE